MQFALIGRSSDSLAPGVPNPPSKAKGLLLTGCHVDAQNVGSLVGVTALNWKTEVVHISFNWLQEGGIFKTDLNINGVLLRCRMTRGD